MNPDFTLPAHIPDALRQAIRFLTVIPIPIGQEETPESIASSVFTFPLVGLLVGLIGMAVGAIAFELVGSPLALIMIVVCGAAVSGGFHLDGLADTSDALFSWRDRERKLEIMKDSRIGSMAVLALISILLLKVGSLISLGSHWWVGAVLAPCWGRWADVYGIISFPAAKSEGLAAQVQSSMGKAHLTWATLFAVGFSLLAAPVWTIFLVPLLWALTHFAAQRMVRSLGGLTGDTYGALSEVIETCCLLALAMFSNLGL